MNIKRNKNVTDSTDIAVIGGGVIGLATAWRLAQRGLRVTLIERGRVGEEASGAAAGMLAPYAEATNRGPFSDLGQASLARYAAFVDELKSETTLDAELIRTGLLRVAEGDEGELQLRATFGAMREMGSNAEWIECTALRQLEPGLSVDVTAAIFSPTEWQLDPRRLTRALSVASAKAGVRILEKTEVIGFEASAGKVAAVKTLAGSIAADRVLLASGSWNRAIAAMLGADIPVKPIRGQIASLGPCYPLPLKHTVYSHHGYLVPRSDGRVLAGSTEDDAGFDSRPTAAGLAGVLARAFALAPSLADAPIESTWAGLRPMCIDRMPILGKLAAWDNAYISAGHFRNGILMAPISAELMADLIFDGCAAVDAAFSPARFGA
jgi:glycine oxidase